MSNLTNNSISLLLYLPEQYLIPCQSQQQSKWYISCLIADWMTTGEQRQLLMIFTITTQCRSKSMIIPSVARTVWKQRYTPQNKNLGIFSDTQRITSFKDKWTIRVQWGTNHKDDDAESKTIWRTIWYQVNWAKKIIWLIIDQRVIKKRRIYISQRSPLSPKTYAWLIVSKLTTSVTSQALYQETFFSK